MISHIVTVSIIVGEKRVDVGIPLTAFTPTRLLFRCCVWVYTSMNVARWYCRVVVVGCFPTITFYFCFQLSYLIFIFNLLCRRTIRQYVEQVFRLCTVLVFPPPFEFSFVHIYTVKSYPHTLSIKILLYTGKILQFVRLLLKVNYMNRIV